jgi:hypothetical protein
MQGGRSQAPGLARGHIAPRQAQWGQVAQARPLCAIHPQQLATPGHAVGAQAHPIERQADHRDLDAMLGLQCCNVRMVVLHAHGGHAQFMRPSLGQLGAEEIGVQVVGDGVDAATTIALTAWPVGQQGRQRCLQRFTLRGLCEIAMQR